VCRLDPVPDVIDITVRIMFKSGTDISAGAATARQHIEELLFTVGKPIISRRRTLSDISYAVKLDPNVDYLEILQPTSEAGLTPAHYSVHPVTGVPSAPHYLQLNNLTVIPDISERV
jgi:hypothetical protein